MKIISHISKGVSHHKYFLAKLTIIEIKNNFVFKMRVRIDRLLFFKILSGKIILAKSKGSLVIRAGVEAEDDYFFQGARLSSNKSTGN